MDIPGIDPSVPPSSDGCVECDRDGGWWVHLRRCAACGHVGCCNDSLARHATAHARETGHPYIQSFEPNEFWFWDYARERFFAGPVLAAPDGHPAAQSVPGPADRVPADWRQVLEQRNAGG